jgi:hypothetical protein
MITACRGPYSPVCRGGGTVNGRRDCGDQAKHRPGHALVVALAEPRALSAAAMLQMAGNFASHTIAMRYKGGATLVLAILSAGPPGALEMPCSPACKESWGSACDSNFH